MHVCPSVCNLPKESATEACLLLYEYLLAETSIFKQYLLDGILHRQSFCCCIDRAYLFFVLFMLPTFSKSSQKFSYIPCCILIQQKSPQECRISVTELIHAPVNELSDSVTTKSSAPSPVLSSCIPHSSLSLSLYLLFLVILCSQCQVLYTQYFWCQAVLLTAFLFLQMFSLQKKEKHGHCAGLEDKR